MTPTENIHALSGAYALDALDDLERVRFEAHLTDCDTCSTEVAGFLDTVAEVGSIDELELPEGMRAEVLARIDTVRQIGPIRTNVTRFAPRLSSVAAAVLAVAVVGLSVVTAGLRREVDTLEDQAELAAVLQADELITLSEAVGDGALRIVAAPEAGAGAVIADGLEQAPNGHAYQLWLLHEDGTALSAGLLRVHEDGSGHHLMSGDMSQVVAVGITVEPDGGSEQPTDDPIAVVELSA